MTVIYRVIDESEDFEAILGRGQLDEFATQRVYENAEAFTEDLSLQYEPSEIRTIKKALQGVLNGETLSSRSTSKLMLNVLGYKIIEIKVY